jgi:hypothetical protein
MRDEGEFARYFRAIGVDEGPRTLDTLAARHAGSRVADELRGMARPDRDVTLATATATDTGAVATAARTVAGS